MFEIFKTLVKQEAPDYIIDNKSVGCGQLQSMTCVYAKSKKYYTATTFYTDVWISKSPLGPLSGDTPVVKTLSDVAVIREYDSFQACSSFPPVTKQDLESYIAQMNMGVDDYLAGLLPNGCGDVCKFKLNLNPVPCVVVSVFSGRGLIGTMIIFMDGHVIPVMSCSARMNDYVSLARQRSTTGGPKFRLGIPAPLYSEKTIVTTMSLGGD